MKRKCKAQWKGAGGNGSGQLTSPSGVLSNTNYSAQTRFENENGTAGTNPEELIAAAHAGCYAMALSFALKDEGYDSEKIDVTAYVTLKKDDNGFTITTIDLHAIADIPKINQEQFETIARTAKDGCPVSKALDAVPINLDAELV